MYDSINDLLSATVSNIPIFSYVHNILPLNTIQSGEDVYIYNHQKALSKYFSELDVLEQDASLLENFI